MLCCYYRRFIKNYASISQPLTTLLKENAFKWSVSAKLAYNQWKKAMMEAPVLGLHNFAQEFVVETDASGTGIGALNKYTVKDKFPIPVIEELIDKLNGSAVFSKLDLSINELQELETKISKPGKSSQEWKIRKGVGPKSEFTSLSKIDSPASIPFPPGFTPADVNSDHVNHVSPVVDSIHPSCSSSRNSSRILDKVDNSVDRNSLVNSSNGIKNMEGGSMLELLEELITVGQTMGFSMEGYYRITRRTWGFSMNCLSLNVQGLGSEAKKDWIKELISIHKVPVQEVNSDDDSVKINEGEIMNIMVKRRTIMKWYPTLSLEKMMMISSSRNSSRILDKVDNSVDRNSLVNSSNGIKNMEGGSMLELLEELITVGQTMGFLMEGCFKDMENIIGLQGEHGVFR
nr:retrotransposon-related protein [Tanacetum cinerariifolium]